MHDGSRTTWLALAGILVFGIALRGLYFAEVVDTVHFTYPSVDAGFHHYWAKGLATGDWTPPAGCEPPRLDGSPYLRPPGYPYFLALIYRVAGSGPVAPAIVQMGLGLLNCVLAFVLARRVFNGTVGLIAAGLMSTYWVFIYYETKLHAATLLMTLLLLIMMSLTRWVDRPSLRRGVMAGILIGLFALVRPTILPCVVVVAVWGLWLGKRQHMVRRFCVAIGGMVVATAAVIAPATIRNYVASGDVVLVSSNAGMNLYIGNNAAARGVFTDAVAEMEGVFTCFDLPRLYRRVARQVGHPISHAEASAYLGAKAVHYVAEHPLRTVMLMGRKVLLFWGSTEIALNEHATFDRSASRVLSAIPIGFAPILGLAVVGGVAGAIDRRRSVAGIGSHEAPVRPNQWPMVVLIVAFVVTYSATFLPFFVAGLYRLALVPLVVLLAAFGMYRLITFARARRYVAVAVGVGGAAAVYGLSSANLGGYQPSLAQWHYQRGVAYYMTGDATRAVEEYEAALRVQPRHVSALHNLAVMMAKSGEYERGIDLYRQALRLSPSAADIHYNLAVALGKAGRGAEAVEQYRQALAIRPDYVDAHVNLGLVMFDAGRYDVAIAHGTDAVRLSPSNAEAHHYLGLALAATGRLGEAKDHLSEAVRLGPEDAGAWCNLGNTALMLGDSAAAIQHYEKALSIDAANVEAQNNLGLALAERGQLAQAATHCREATLLAPDYANAHFGLANILVDLGQPNEAIEHYQRVLALRPGFEPAQRRLDALRASTGSPGSD